MSLHRVPGIEAYPDLVRRFENKLARTQAGDDCGGCKTREVIETFTKLVQQRQKRDKDFFRR